jgi:two-component system C4-dicarboxylate transport sensor histidine kinase DctB
MDRVAIEEAVPAAWVQVDPQRLALALANLVFNAADALAGRDGARVSLRADIDIDGERLSLHVDDNGPGLPDAVREHLFEPFFTTRPEGLGLGLTLSSEALAAMGGQLTASNRPGGGARFTIELPIAAPNAGPVSRPPSA